MEWYWVGVGLVLAAVAAVGIVAGRASAAARQRAEVQRRQDEEAFARAAWEAARRDLALTCRGCRSLAPPIRGTGNRYKCDACGNQFAGARHGQ